MGLCSLIALCYSLSLSLNLSISFLPLVYVRGFEIGGFVCPSDESFQSIELKMP